MLGSSYSFLSIIMIFIIIAKRIMTVRTLNIADKLDIVSENSNYFLYIK